MSLLKDKVELGIEEAEFETQKALGGFPPLLRWLVIILAIAIIPAYFTAKNISRKIWSSRYSQGAIAAKPSFTAAKDPDVSQVSLTTLGANTYNATVKVSNKNLNLSLDSTPFELDFYNSQKQLVYKYSDQIFLLPDQSKYVVAPKFTSSDQITSANFSFSDKINWQYRLGVPEIKFVVPTPNTYQQASPQAFVTEGNFVNESPYNIKKVHITFVIFNANNQIIGSSARDEFTIAPFERRAYKQLWPNIYVPDLGHVQVSVDTNTLDPNNLAVPQAPSSGAGDLSRPTNSR